MKVHASMLALTIAVASGLQSASAHHAFAAEFDGSQPFIVEGQITKIKWVNPHSWLYFDVKASDGSVVNWGVEFGTPSVLANRGLTKDVLQIGSTVTVKGFRSRTGEAIGYSSILVLSDGRTFLTGGAQDVPATPGITSGDK